MMPYSSQKPLKVWPRTHSLLSPPIPRSQSRGNKTKIRSGDCSRPVTVQTRIRCLTNISHEINFDLIPLKESTRHQVPKRNKLFLGKKISLCPVAIELEVVTWPVTPG